MWVDAEVQVLSHSAYMKETVAYSGPVNRADVITLVYEIPFSPIRPERKCIS